MAAKKAKKKKTVLVVGGGGREHALAWAFRKSPKVETIFVAPGNAGTAQIARNVAVGTGEVEALVKLAQKEKVDLTVVGPEAPLAEGIVDRFAAAGLPIFGPTKQAARIESSKIFAKELALKAGIPTAPAEIFDDVGAAKRYIDISGAPCVVKADGLAAGKGVTVAMTEDEAYAAVEEAMVEKRFGGAGDRILIEDYVSGEEASILAITDGERIAVMIPSQDHKRLKDGDGGPNTGGMGAYAPAPVIDGKLLKTVTETVIEPTVRALGDEGTPYRGCLYAGLIVDFEGPKLLEFNCRFGDPEAQAVLPLLENDLYDVCASATAGHLEFNRFEWRPGAAVAVVAASKGYPGEYEKGRVIKGLDEVAALEDVVVFHAGTAIEDDKVVTAGGRVFAVTALGVNVAAAIEKAYAAMDKIRFTGMHYRRDIGHKAIARSRG